jgi:hypothetical protein
MTLETLAFQKAVTEDNVNGLPVRLIDSSGNPLLLGPAADGLPATGLLASADLLFNGATWDRPRGQNGAAFDTLSTPTQVNLVATRTDTVNYTGADTAAPAFTVALFTFHITAISGTSPAVTFSVQGKDTQGNYSANNGGVASSSQTTVTSAPLTISPGVAGSNILLSPTYRVVALISGTSPSVTWYCDIVYK